MPDRMMAGVPRLKRERLPPTSAAATPKKQQSQRSTTSQNQVVRQGDSSDQTLCKSVPVSLPTGQHGEVSLRDQPPSELALPSVGSSDPNWREVDVRHTAGTRDRSPVPAVLRPSLDRSGVQPSIDSSAQLRAMMDTNIPEDAVPAQKSSEFPIAPQVVSDDGVGAADPGTASNTFPEDMLRAVRTAFSPFYLQCLNSEFLPTFASLPTRFAGVYDSLYLLS
jgi:hypothetical protein